MLIHPRVTMSIFVAISVATLTAQQPPSDAATAVLRGRVVDAATAQPIPMARVRLAPVKPGAMPDHHTRTDAEGRYAFTGVRPGQVVITASKARYVTLQHGQVPPAAAGRPIDVKAGATLERLDVALPRASAITGRIVDEFGEPLERAQVAAMRMRVVDGRRQLASAGTGTTNDNGEYRIPALQPGHYYVVAAERVTGFGSSMEADIGFARTAWPAATTMEGARPIEVRAGADTRGVDIALLPADPVRLSGLVLARDGQPASNAWVVLQPIGTGPGAGMGGDMRTGADGRFVFPRVLPGRYDLHVRGDGDRSGAMVALAPSADTDIVVPLVSGRMTGRVVPPEGAKAPPSAVNLAVTPVAETNVFGTGFGGSPKDDWTFDFDFLIGPRVLRPQRLPEGWYLESIHRDGADVTDTVFTFTGNDVVSGLEVVLTTDAASVRGTVAADDPAACTVILFADDAGRWSHPSRFVHATKLDQDRGFRFEGLPRAEYRIAAVEDIEEGEWTLPDVLERLRGLAERVDLRSGGSAAVSLKVVRP